MDDKWFKRRQKEVGVTAEDIANEMGRARSGVSHIYSGHQRMSLDWARAFAKVLDVPLDEILKHAGVAAANEAQTLAPGFSESDAMPFIAKGGEEIKEQARAEQFGGNKPGVDIWQVKSDALILKGFLLGDRLLVDSHQSERCKAGDVVLAQVFNWKSASGVTLLRQFQPPVLVSANTDPNMQDVHVVDGKNVVIKGKVIAAWRAMT